MPDPARQRLVDAVVAAARLIGVEEDAEYQLVAALEKLDESLPPAPPHREPESPREPLDGAVHALTPKREAQFRYRVSRGGDHRVTMDSEVGELLAEIDRLTSLLVREIAHCEEAIQLTKSAHAAIEEHKRGWNAQAAEITRLRERDVRP